MQECQKIQAEEPEGKRTPNLSTRRREVNTGKGLKQTRKKGMGRTLLAQDRDQLWGFL